MTMMYEFKSSATSFLLSEEKKKRKKENLISLFRHFGVWVAVQPQSVLLLLSLLLRLTRVF